MLDTIIEKLRPSIEDNGSEDTEVFTYTTSNIFPLSENNISSVLQVKVNDVETTNYELDSDNREVKITDSLTDGDNILIKYEYSKYSDTVLKKYIVSALVFISIDAPEGKDYEVEGDDIIPTPNNKELDLITLVASIIIKPNYNEKRLPNMTVKYPKNKRKEDVIKELVKEFYQSKIGFSDVIDLEAR